MILSIWAAAERDEFWPDCRLADVSFRFRQSGFGYAQECSHGRLGPDLSLPTQRGHSGEANDRRISTINDSSGRPHGRSYAGATEL